MTKKIFSLDIGTRSVVGVILEEISKNSFHVIDLVIQEHKERAMVDGQIHNVLHVAEVITSIKEQLEQKHGTLTEVNVAAAGRSLKTERATIEITIKNRSGLTEEDISRFELSAVQQAQQQLVAERSHVADTHYYCVGYSVVYYRLDGQEIGSLIDQQGEVASVEVIATFLPRVVVESLLASLQRANLEMAGLTLEPIAAINALIPPTMRRLNVALVDIGAGTSDIAITDKSTVVAYGMVPTAGDEITEALSDHYLLDFPIAETIKKQLSTNENVAIEDILGFTQQIETTEVISILSPAIDHLAQSIAQEILQLNSHQAPKAILLVGGGSLTPHLPKRLSEALQLPEQRVAVRDLNAIQNLTREAHIPATAEIVTPIGIAIAAQHAPIKYMTVTVNKQKIRLFELKEMTISDALLAANVVASKLYGKPGLGMTISINEQDVHIPGKFGEASKILLNGETASMKTPICNNAQIELIEGTNGTHATATVQDVIDTIEPITFTCNSETYTVSPTITINGELASIDTVLQDGDCLTVTMVQTIEEALKAAGQEALLQGLEPFTIYLENQLVSLNHLSGQLLVNGVPRKMTNFIQQNDTITIQAAIPPSIDAVLQLLNRSLYDQLTVTFEKETLHLQRQHLKVLLNKAEATLDTIVSTGSHIQLIAQNIEPWTFQHVFKFTNWRLPENFTGTFSLMRNEEIAQFDTPIFGGDRLTIQLIPTSLATN